MSLPTSSRVLKDGWLNRGFGRSFTDRVISNIPGTIFGDWPKTKVRIAGKNLKKKLRPQFFNVLKEQCLNNLLNKPSGSHTARDLMKMDITKIMDFSKQVIFKRQEYLAIPAGMYAGHKIAKHIMTPKIPPETKFQKILNAGIKEIENYAHKAADRPVMTSLAIGGAIYGASKLWNIKKVSGQESENGSI